GRGVENRTPNARLDRRFNSGQYLSQGDLAVDEGAVPPIHYLLKTRFRALKFRITAHGIDGKDYVSYRTLAPRYNSRFARPGYMYMEPGYWDAEREVTQLRVLFDDRTSNGNLFNYSLPHCSATTDCPNDCVALNGDLPCFECQPDGICRAREWEDKSIEQERIDRGELFRTSTQKTR
ncbi:MAG: hypothetical protein HYY44_08005, partial [Deltaproteobacteria bacterium]|nr:hypothetical protein [Deltaproteobacteria bacterium]